jgi:Ser/Thr protein kinase RdoA (MazF antagonist)
VQTHGRYHHDHVFVSEKSVAVIDLDRCRVGDAGKDVAEFLRVLRPVAFKRAFDMALVEKATSTFLKEYLSLVPDATVSLGCYWSASMFYSFLGTLKKQHNREKREWQEMLDFYVREMKLSLDIA